MRNRAILICANIDTVHEGDLNGHVHSTAPMVEDENNGRSRSIRDSGPNSPRFFIRPAGDSDGTLDSTLSTNGKQTVNFGGDDVAYELENRRNAKIMLFDGYNASDFDRELIGMTACSRRSQRCRLHVPERNALCPILQPSDDGCSRTRWGMWTAPNLYEYVTSSPTSLRDPRGLRYEEGGGDKDAGWPDKTSPGGVGPKPGGAGAIAQPGGGGATAPPAGNPIKSYPLPKGGAIPVKEFYKGPGTLANLSSACVIGWQGNRMFTS
jgi:hypothetical protein